MSEVNHWLQVSLHLGGEPVPVYVPVDPDIYEPVNKVTAWSVLSYMISKGTISIARGAGGEDVIVNWQNVPAVSYVNPWPDIEPRPR